MDTTVGVMAAAFVIGGRIFYLAGHLSAFLGSPASIISLNAGLFDTWGALVSAVIAAAAVMQRKRLPAWQTLDLLASLLASLGIGLALSHIASGAAFGKETNVPWAVNLWGAQRHPTQVYELVAGIVVLGVVWLRGEGAPSGRLFLLWAAMAAASRLFIEGFRGDSTLVFDGLRLAQIVAWGVLAAALVGLEIRQRARVNPVVAANKEQLIATEVESAPSERKRRPAPGKNSAP